MGSDHYLIDRILPARELSLLTGRSGSGKTRLLFSMLSAWESGEPVFGHESYPAPWTYLSMDRSRESVCRSLVEMEYDPAAFRIVGRENVKGRVCATTLLDTYHKHFPDTRLWVIEGLVFLVGRGRDFNSGPAVYDLCTELMLWCKKRNATIIGVTPSSKANAREGEMHGREGVIGSVAWGLSVESVFQVSFSQRGHDYRRLEIYNHNARQEEIDLQFDERGRLTPLPVLPTVESMLLEAGENANVKEIARVCKKSVATVYRIAQSLKSGASSTHHQ